MDCRQCIASITKRISRPRSREIVIGRPVICVRQSRQTQRLWLIANLIHQHGTAYFISAGWRLPRCSCLKCFDLLTRRGCWSEIRSFKARREGGPLARQSTPTGSS